VRPWTRLRSHYLYESRWFNLRQDAVRLPDGDEITYTMVEHPGFSMVVPLLDDDRVVLERVYRYTLQRPSIECPAGGLDGDTPEAAARRELREETGYVAGTIEALGSYTESTGISNEVFHVFLATDLTYTGEIEREATEDIEVFLLPLDEAVERALGGDITDSATAISLLRAQRRLRR
jgi:ADP-ribose pyrophosphatase